MASRHAGRCSPPNPDSPGQALTRSTQLPPLPATVATGRVGVLTQRVAGGGQRLSPALTTIALAVQQHNGKVSESHCSLELTEKMRGEGKLFD